MAILKIFQVFKKFFRFPRPNALPAASAQKSRAASAALLCDRYEISIHLTLLSSLAKVMLNTRPPGVTMVRK